MHLTIDEGVPDVEDLGEEEDERAEEADQAIVETTFEAFELVRAVILSRFNFMDVPLEIRSRGYNACIAVLSCSVARLLVVRTDETSGQPSTQASD